MFSDGVRQIVSLWLNVSPKFREYLTFAALGIATALSFTFPGCSEVDDSCLGYFRFLNGLLFIVSFGFFFRKIFEYKEESLFVSGFVYWLFYYIGTLYWLVYPLTIDISLHWVLIPFALIAIPTYLSIPLLLPIYVTKRFCCNNVWNAALAFAILNFFVMYFFGHYAPGFPWALPGYVWRESEEFMQAFSIWGIYGQTLFTLMISCIVGVGFYWSRISLKNSCWAVGVALSLLVTLFLFGLFRIPNDACEFTDYKLRCVQGSIHQKNKMNRSLASDNLNLYLNLSQMKSESKNWSPDLIIWPEASVPYLFTDQSKTLIKKLANIVPSAGYLLAGAVRKDSFFGDIYNSVIVLDEFGKNIVNYDKKHLVPFGEYIPFRSFIPKVFAPIANSIGDFAVGKNSNVIDLKGLKIALTICYEAIFSGEFISNEDSDIDVIVNITNDAWFGHTSELVQHLNIVRARAIEEGIPLVRVTNFGISAVFDAYGRKVKMLNTDKLGVMDFYVPKKIKKTFFRKFFMDKMKLKQ